MLQENSVSGINLVDSVLSVKNYVRSLKGQQLLKEVLDRWEWFAYFIEEDHITKYRQQFDALVYI